MNIVVTNCMLHFMSKFYTNKHEYGIICIFNGIKCDLNTDGVHPLFVSKLKTEYQAFVTITT